MSETRLPSIEDFANAEHCVLEDVTAEVPALDESAAGTTSRPREVTARFVLRDALRGRSTSVSLYAEGWAYIETARRKRKAARQRVNLGYLDPKPEIENHFPILLLKIAGALAGFAVLSAGAWWFDLWPTYTLQAAIVGTAMSISTLLLFLFRSHQKVVYRTLRGRAEALRLIVGVGLRHRLRKRLPAITAAIRAANAAVCEDTGEYLRAEMREHYRLLNDGTLTEHECSESTGRILARFDGLS